MPLRRGGTLECDRMGLLAKADEDQAVTEELVLAAGWDGATQDEVLAVVNTVKASYATFGSNRGQISLQLLWPP